MKISPTGWIFKEIGLDVPLGSKMVDNDLSTAWISSETLTLGKGIIIDLGKKYVVHRLFITPGKSEGSLPRQFQVVFSDETDNIVSTLNATLSVNRPDANLYFNPIIARYIRLKAIALNEQQWTISEVEIYGSNNPAAFIPGDAIIIDSAISPIPTALSYAAEDLRYYLGELTGRPLPIILTAAVGTYPGTLYRIIDLKPLATTWTAMQDNRQSGTIPATVVNVEINGREVLFKAFPYANVRHSVWAFLEQQGVRWLYPDDHGDYVPTGQGISLSCLPLQYNPSATRRYANFNTVSWTKPTIASNDQSYLFWWRNGYESSWDSPTTVLGGNEVPADPYKILTTTQLTVPYPDYKEGFLGYPHNFTTVIPSRIINLHLNAYPNNWAGFKNDVILPYSQCTCCMTSPEVIQFVIDKAIAVTAYSQSTAVLNLMPMDGAKNCE